MSPVHGEVRNGLMWYAGPVVNFWWKPPRRRLDWLPQCMPEESQIQQLKRQIAEAKTKKEDNNV